jgi:hypothetical protein
MIVQIVRLLEMTVGVEFTVSQELLWLEAWIEFRNPEERGTSTRWKPLPEDWCRHRLKRPMSVL